ncbi:hypothetical protein BC937DRAFT_89106 [Endogone sp. FLAS-F59071]|nr:hypothetical protein BC937DRAFT_89106 [Endogone sp. FLAS-F59071]|eukprot:RUS18139.1 hypothetical protein BC937DRAFT_89106 [Endogone sp. FLAS-F59071]
MILIVCLGNRKLAYHWNELWHAMISLTKFVVAHAEELKAKPEFDELIELITGLFNVCITFGETFLPDAVSYDNLFYEVVRSGDVFATLDTLASCHSETRLHWPPAAAKHAVPIRGHDEYPRHLHSLQSEDRRVAAAATCAGADAREPIINKHYDTLELVTVDKMELPMRYSEMPAETSFFRQLLRTIVADFATT